MIGQAERVIDLHDRLYGSAAPNSPVITFTSGKGGTGKSFLSLNLAYALAAKGKKTLICDFDWNFSNLHILLNEHPLRTIGDYFSSRAQLEEIIFRYTDNMHIIFGDAGLSEQPEINAVDIKGFFRQILSSAIDYDVVIIDTGSGADSILLEIAKRSTGIVVVANTEPTSIMDAYAMLKLLKSSSCEAKRMLLINKALSETEGLEAYENLKRAIKHFLNESVALLGIINESPSVHTSIKKQQLFLQDTKDDLLNEQLLATSHKLAKSLLLKKSRSKG